MMRSFGIKIGLITGMCSLIVMGICIMDLVHILTGHQKNNGNIVASLDENLKPTLLTSVTTIIGFLSFFSAKLLPITDLGLIACIGIALAWYFSIFLISSMLYLIPIKQDYRVQSREFKTLANFISRQPIKIALGFTVLTLLGLHFVLSNKIDSNMQNYFGNGTEFKQVLNKFKNKIGATESIDLIIDSPTNIKDPQYLAKVDHLIKTIEKRDDVTKIISLLPKIKD